MFSLMCSSRSSRTSAFEENGYTTRSTKMVCRSVAASSVAYRKKCGCSSRQGNEQSALHVTKSESKLLTIRKRLHSKFSFDPSSSLHDLTKARENIIILREIRKNTKPRRRSGDIHQKEHSEGFEEASTAQLYRSKLVRPLSRNTAWVLHQACGSVTYSQKGIERVRLTGIQTGWRKLNDSDRPSAVCKSHYVRIPMPP